MSNFYRTLDDFDAYFGDRLHERDWSTATNDDKRRAAIAATRAADSLKYANNKAEADQALEFPRLEDEQTVAADLANQAWLLTVDATGGSFKMVFNGETTGNLFYVPTTTAAGIQAELEMLSGVTAGDLTVTGENGGPYTITLNDQYATPKTGNTFTIADNALTGGGQTAKVTVVEDNIPADFFYGICEEARSLLIGKDPEQEFENLVLTSDGVSSTRVSSDRSQMPPLHISHLITSAIAWKYFQRYLDPNNTFEFTRSS